MSYRGKGLLPVALIAGAAYWASKQPGGVQGTWNRLQQGFKDVTSGQDPMEVGKRFIRGEDAHMMTSEYREMDDEQIDLMRGERVSTGIVY